MKQKIRTIRKLGDGELGRGNDRSGFVFHGRSFNSFLECLNTRLRADDYRTSMPFRLNQELLKRQSRQMTNAASLVEPRSAVYWH